MLQIPTKVSAEKIHAFKASAHLQKRGSEAGDMQNILRLSQRSNFAFRTSTTPYPPLASENLQKKTLLPFSPLESLSSVTPTAAEVVNFELFRAVNQDPVVIIHQQHSVFFFFSR